jgi:hypothetical protein
MKSLSKVMAIALVTALAGSGLVSSPAEGAQKPAKYKRTRAIPRDDVRRDVAFPARDVRILSQYYAPQHRSLPPGLQKKLRRTGQLPPGWQKKMRPFPSGLERQLILLPPRYERGFMDGYGVIFDRRTQSIVDLARLY